MAWKPLRRVNGYQALLQWELLATFLQDSAHHFFENRNSPVFLQLSIFHNPVFTAWLLGDFRDQILQLQLKANVCYKHIRDKRKETTLLDVVFSERGQPHGVAAQISMLDEVYNRRSIGVRHAFCFCFGGGGVVEGME